MQYVISITLNCDLCLHNTYVHMYLCVLIFKMYQALLRFSEHVVIGVRGKTDFWNYEHTYKREELSQYSDILQDLHNAGSLGVLPTISIKKKQRDWEGNTRRTIKLFWFTKLYIRVRGGEFYRIRSLNER